MPDVPERPTIRERARGVELRWTAVETTTAGGGGGGEEGDEAGAGGPLLYIVDSRWNIGREQNDDDMTPWQQVAQVGQPCSSIAVSIHRVKYIFYLESIRPIRTAENFEAVEWATGFSNKHGCIVGL